MLSKLLFIIFRLFAFLIGILPFWLIYLLSDFTAFTLYRIIKYRKKVVMSNLKKAFPNETDKDLKTIAKGFYKNLGDIMLETIKGFRISKKQLLKRWRILNPEILNKYYDTGRDVINLASHYANWEWGILASDMQIQHQAASIYMPMTNKYMDEWAHRKRERFGMQMISIKNTRDFFMSKKPKPVSIILAADQNPTNMKKSIMAKFFGYDTPCLHGAEEYARAANIPIVYFDVQRVKRGYYTLEIIDMFSEPAQTNYGEITQAYMNMLEEIIRHKPQNYLWSHRRWKHSLEQIEQMMVWHQERTTKNNE